MTIGALGAPVTSCHEPDGSDRINLSFDVTPQTGEIELRVKPSAQSAWSAPRRFSYLPPPSSLQPKTGPAIFKGPADRGKAAIDPAPGKGPRSPFEARRPKPPMGDRPLLHKAPTAPSAVRKPGPRVTPVAPAPGKPRAGKAASVTPSAEADDAAPATPTGATAAPAATPQRIQKKQRSLGTK
jgi:hypothetical protein